VPNWNQIMLATGTCNHWMIMTKDAAIGSWYGGTQRQILKSYLNANPYNAQEYRRQGNNEDPWLQPETRHSQATALYVEGNYNANGGNGQGKKYRGLNVYVRGTTGEVELAINKITSSSASCDGCSSNTGCDPRGPMRLIRPCDATVCRTVWGCGGSCTAGVLTVNGNGQGEWCSRSGSAESAGGQWLDLDLGSSKTVTSIQLWSGASRNRFPQKVQILTGGAADGSTKGGNGCFDKGSLSATAGSWDVAAGPFIIGTGTSLSGCSNARSKAGINTQSDSDKCVVPLPAGAVRGRHIRLHFLGTAGNDNYMELRALKVFGH